MKDIIILAGPNGAGKTTAAQKLVPKKLGITEFVNADEIARGLSPFNADAAALAAGRVMIGRMRYLIHTGTSFAFETTCAGKGHIGMLRQCKSDGWRITLLYLWLPSPDHALDRVVRRVRSGGHNIPAATIIRRYWSGLRNLQKLYLPLADMARIYDNSDLGPVLIAEKTSDSPLMVYEPMRWNMIEKSIA